MGGFKNSGERFEYDSKRASQRRSMIIGGGSTPVGNRQQGLLNFSLIDSFAEVVEEEKHEGEERD